MARAVHKEISWSDTQEVMSDAAGACAQALQSGPSPQRSALLPRPRSAQLFEVPPTVLPVPEAPPPQSFPLALAGAGRQAAPPRHVIFRRLLCAHFVFSHW